MVARGGGRTGQAAADDGCGRGCSRGSSPRALGRRGFGEEEARSRPGAAEGGARDREGESEMGIGMSEGDGGAGGRVRGEERDRGTELGLVIGAAGLQEGWWA